jgi:hypothetical protein
METASEHASAGGFFVSGRCPVNSGSGKLRSAVNIKFRMPIASSPERPFGIRVTNPETRRSVVSHRVCKEPPRISCPPERPSRVRRRRATYPQRRPLRIFSGNHPRRLRNQA